METYYDKSDKHRYDPERNAAYTLAYAGSAEITEQC